MAQKRCEQTTGSNGIYRRAAGMRYTFKASKYMNRYHLPFKSISIGYLSQGLTNPTARRPGQVLPLVGQVVLLCITLLRTSENQGRASHLKIYLSAPVSTHKLLLFAAISPSFHYFAVKRRRRKTQNCECQFVSFCFSLFVAKR